MAALTSLTTSLCLPVPETAEPFAGIPQIIDAAQQAKLTTLGLHQLMVSTAAENGATAADCQIRQRRIGLRRRPLASGV